MMNLIDRAVIGSGHETSGWLRAEDLAPAVGITVTIGTSTLFTLDRPARHSDL